MHPNHAVFAKAVSIRELLSELNAQPEDHNELIPTDADWLERFSKLNDLTYVTRKTHYSWWIGGEYRVHGPDVVSRPAENCKWHGEPEKNIEADWIEAYLGGDPIDQGLEYYEKMGICDDTGTTWAFDEKSSLRQNIWHFAMKRRMGDDPNSQEVDYLNPLLYKSINMKYSRNISAVVPKIGLRGYSYNTSSCGGLWAGYRLYLGDHPRIEFSPLAWDDVREYLEPFQTYEDNWEDRYLEATNAPMHYKVKGNEPSSPEMIVEISIIRPGEEAPPSHPHHCWEPVAGNFSNCGDLQGVDWRQTVPIRPRPTEEEFKKFMAPGFNRRVSDKDKLLLCEREEKLLKNLNGFRIRKIFKLVLEGTYDTNHPPDFPVPRHFHESKVPSGSTT